MVSRPILDSLKERLFNILADRVSGSRVWDVFAGVGSMGLEALSRGAEAAVFVEKDRRVFDVLRRNIRALGYEDRATALRADALAVRGGRGESPADLIFFDPPFPMVLRDADRVHEGLVRLAESVLSPDGLIVYRSPTQAPPWRPARVLREVDHREHGVNRLQFLQLD